MIAGRRILCNAHGVAHAASVRVRRYGQPNKYSATVLHVNHDADLALLAVAEPGFWNELPALAFSRRLPSEGDEVFCVGYPDGGDNISVTRGIVSRIAAHPYAHSGCQLLVVQIDAAINSGNSGGPALENGKVVGVAFESLDETDNIGYVIPWPVVDRFLEGAKRAAAGQSWRIPTIPIVWQPIENPAMRAALRVEREDRGVLVVRTLVAPAATAGSATPSKDAKDAKDAKEAADGVLRVDDVLLAIDGKPIGCDGTFALRSNLRVTFDQVVAAKYAGDQVTFDVIRQGAPRRVTLTLGDVEPLVPIHCYDRPPRYLVYGGLVFTTLSVPYLQSAFGDKWDEQAPVPLLYQADQGERQSPTHEIVVVARVLSGAPSLGYGVAQDSIVLLADSVPITSLGHLARLLKVPTPDSTFSSATATSTLAESKTSTSCHSGTAPALLRLDLLGRQRSVVFIDRELAKRSERNLLALYNIHSASML